MDDLSKRIISDTIARDKVGRTLTPQAQERAADFAANLSARGLNWGQLKDIGISHVTEGILKDK